MTLKKVDSLILSTTHGPCEIQLLLGDITKLSMQDKVDLLIVSAFPRELLLKIINSKTFLRFK